MEFGVRVCVWIRCRVWSRNWVGDKVGFRGLGRSLELGFEWNV